MYKAVLIAGTRHGTMAVWGEVLYRALRSEPRLDGGVLIHGAQRRVDEHGITHGIDTLAGEVGRSLGWQVVPVPAQWDVYGKPAGPKRNREMRDLLGILNNHDYQTAVHVFTNNLESSVGTRDMSRIARESGWEVTWWSSNGVSRVLRPWKGPGDTLPLFGEGVTYGTGKS